MICVDKLIFVCIGVVLLFAPDGSGKPFESKMYFFLELKSDHRSSFTSLEKSIFEKKLATTAGLRLTNLE
jgi:hypothetical protein